jgi:hypothetical protein
MNTMSNMPAEQQPSDSPVADHVSSAPTTIMTSGAGVASTQGSTGSPAGGVHDLRGLFRAIGSFSGTKAATSIEPRSNCDVPVELLEDVPARVGGSALTVSGFVDGIQSSLVVTHRQHRPVHLNYTAAAAVDRNIRPIGIREQLELVVGEDDLDWARSLQSTVPLSVLPAADPAETERLAVMGLGGTRERLERGLVDDLLLEDAGRLVLDGSLVARPADPRLLGVVKTTRRRYLDDESVLWGLRSGWRSPLFRIPAGSQAYPADRYSCYLRLSDAAEAAWDHGLIRLEALDPELLEPLASLCMQERQHARSSDPRGDRHLRPVRMCEELLRARRPAVFSL